MRQQPPNGSDLSIAVTVDAFLQPLPSDSATGLLTASIQDSSGRRRWGAQQKVTVPVCGATQACAASAAASGGTSRTPAPEMHRVAADPGSCGGGLPEGSMGVDPAAVAPPLGSCAGGAWAGALLGAVRRQLSVRVTAPYELWYPHEFGAQPLYTVVLEFTPDNSTARGARGASGSGSKSSLQRFAGKSTFNIMGGEGRWRAAASCRRPHCSAAPRRGQSFPC